MDAFLFLAFIDWLTERGKGMSHFTRLCKMKYFGRGGGGVSVIKKVLRTHLPTQRNETISDVCLSQVLNNSYWMEADLKPTTSEYCSIFRTEYTLFISYHTLCFQLFDSQTNCWTSQSSLKTIWRAFLCFFFSCGSLEKATAFFLVLVFSSSIPHCPILSVM